MKNIDNNRYFLYARKSSESEEKQVQSLDDQIRVMKKKAIQLGVKIIEIFEESMSAKAPGRYKFDEMVKKIDNGEADGIISWKLDRISRNPIDSGIIQYMLQNGTLNRIITNDREYNPIDAGLLMSVENGMSNQFIIDLKKNTRRGLDSKYEKGIRPSRVPIGYLNLKETKTIDIDNERFDLVRGMWDLMLTGNYNPSEINKIYAEKFGLRTRLTPKLGGKKLTKSGIYRVFHNIFYTGYFYYKGDLVEGKHKAMITLEEFDRVQTLLGEYGRPRKKKHYFPFTGMIRCGECGCSITAEKKHKYIKSTKETKEFIYYHCTKRKVGTKCSQKTISGIELEKQILNELEFIEIIPEFKDFAIEIIKEEYNNEFDVIIKKSENIEKTIISEEKQLKRLTDFLLRDIIDEKEFKIKKKELNDSITKLKVQRNNIDTKGKEVLDLTLDAFKFANKAKKSFSEGSMELKKNIFSTIGQNFILKDKKIAVGLTPWFKTIKNELQKNDGNEKRLEPTKKGNSKVNTEASFNKSCLWYLERESNPHSRSRGILSPLCLLLEKIKNTLWLKIEVNLL